MNQESLVRVVTPIGDVFFASSVYMHDEGGYCHGTNSIRMNVIGRSEPVIISRHGNGSGYKPSDEFKNIHKMIVDEFINTKPGETLDLRTMHIKDMY